MSQTPKLKMFDSYQDLTKKQQPVCSSLVQSNVPMSSTGTHLLTDITGKTIGLEGKAGNPLTIYFTLDGDAEQLFDLFQNGIFGFEVLDCKHNTVLSAPVQVSAENNQLAVSIVSEREGILKYENYYMYLYVLYEGIYHTLFDTQDGILSFN